MQPAAQKHMAGFLCDSWVSWSFNHDNK